LASLARRTVCVSEATATAWWSAAAADIDEQIAALQHVVTVASDPARAWQRQDDHRRSAQRPRPRAAPGWDRSPRPPAWTDRSCDQAHCLPTAADARHARRRLPPARLPGPHLIGVRPFTLACTDPTHQGGTPPSPVAFITLHTMSTAASRSTFWRSRSWPSARACSSTASVSSSASSPLRVCSLCPRPSWVCHCTSQPQEVGGSAQLVITCDAAFRPRTRAFGRRPNRTTSAWINRLYISRFTRAR